MTLSANRKIIIAVVAGIVIIGAVVGVLLFTRGSGKDPEELIAFGMQHLADYDYDAAILSFRDALRIDPKNEEARNGLIRALLEHGAHLMTEERYDEAVTVYRELTRLEPCPEYDELLSGAMLMAMGNGKQPETGTDTAPVQTEPEPGTPEYWHKAAHDAEDNGNEEQFLDAEAHLIDDHHAIEGGLYQSETVKEPGCEEEGEEKLTCSLCGRVVRKPIAAKGGHTWDEGKDLTPRSCTAECTVEYTCTECGEKKTETIPAGSAHTWGAWTVISAADCRNPGDRKHTCTVCGAEMHEVLPATGQHKWDAGKVTKQATCAAAGEKTVTCTVCGATQKQTIPATGQHKWDSGKVTKQATCAAAGEKTVTCTVCGKTQKQTIAATGQHKWDAGKVTKEPTPTSTGEKTYTCTVCKTTKKESVAKLSNIVVFDDPELEYAIRTYMLRPSGDITVAEAEAVKSLVLNSDNMRMQGSIKSINVLKYFRNLTEFIIDNTEAVSLTPDQQIVFPAPVGNVIYVDPSQFEASPVYRNEFRDLSALSGLTKLTRLKLPHGAISDISALKNLTNLVVLDLSDNQIKSVSAVSGLTKLENLNLSANQITDISALRGLKNLEMVVLNKNAIKDYSPLDGLPNLISRTVD